MPKYIVHVNVIRTRFIVRPSQNEKNDCIQHQTIALHFQFQAVFLKSLLKTQNYVSWGCAKKQNVNSSNASVPWLLSYDMHVQQISAIIFSHFLVPNYISSCPTRLSKAEKSIFDVSFWIIIIVHNEGLKSYRTRPLSVYLFYSLRHSRLRLYLALGYVFSIWTLPSPWECWRWATASGVRFVTQSSRNNTFLMCNSIYK